MENEKRIKIFLKLKLKEISKLVLFFILLGLILVGGILIGTFLIEALNKFTATFPLVSMIGFITLGGIVVLFFAWRIIGRSLIGWIKSNWAEAGRLSRIKDKKGVNNGKRK